MGQVHYHVLSMLASTTSPPLSHLLHSVPSNPPIPQEPTGWYAARFQFPFEFAARCPFVRRWTRVNALIEFNRRPIPLPPRFIGLPLRSQSNTGWSLGRPFFACPRFVRLLSRRGEVIIIVIQGSRGFFPPNSRPVPRLHCPRVCFCIWDYIFISGKVEDRLLRLLTKVTVTLWER